MVTTRSTLILNPEDDGATESPAFGAWPQIGDRAGQDGNPHVAGAVSIDRRAQALLPTVMAPKHSERLPPPVRGSTRCVKEQGSVITVACRGKRKSQHCCQPCSWRDYIINIAKV